MVQQKPNTPYEPRHLDDPVPQDPFVNELRSSTDLDRELQPDPELAEGPASNTRIALIAVGIAVVLGVVFYGLNSTTMHQQASSEPPPATSQGANPASPSAPPGMRDVTPRSNSQPGTTTGNATSNPQPPSPPSTQSGGADTNTANPSNAPAK